MITAAGFTFLLQLSLYKTVWFIAMPDVIRCGATVVSLPPGPESIMHVTIGANSEKAIDCAEAAIDSAISIENAMRIKARKK